MTVIRDDFHTLQGHGLTVRIAPTGASIASILAPDREGRPGEVVLGLRSATDYAGNPHYFGATVGRFAGRIAGARFEMDGREVRLPENFGRHHLHGGPEGFSHRRWDSPGPGTGLVSDGSGGEVEGPKSSWLLSSPDGDQGWPGRVRASVTYTLEPGRRLRMRFEARTDAPTHVSLTNHAYFDLSGTGDVSGHRVRLDASRVLELADDGVPTGRVLPVEGTPMDFRTSRPLFRDAPHYDHCFVLDGDASPPEPRPCAELVDPSSGRILRVHTTLPGVQLYTPDFGEGTPGRSGEPYRGRGGVCLEAQYLPDAPNQPHFPATRLEPGDVWRHEIVLEFATD